MFSNVRRYPTIVALVALGVSVAAPYALATSIGTNLVMSGTMTVPAAQSLDVASAGTLNIGTTTATLVNIGNTGANLSILGNTKIPAAYSIDVLAAGTLNIGTTTATAITIGKSGVITTIAGGSLSQASSTVVGAQTITGASTLGGTVTVTTTNAATSTVILGCIQTYATSTATPIKFTIGIGGATTTFTGTATTGNGVVAWNYGSCP